MKPIAIGECDACPKLEVDLFEMSGSKMRLCLTCYQAEVKAVEDSKWINSTLQTAKAVDNSIQLKADIYNAATVSFVELKAAIDNDETIPAERKVESFMKAVQERIAKYNEVIFNTRNELQSWSQNTQEFIGKLRAEEREKYKKFNITYTPTPVTKAAIKGKSAKSPKAPSTKFNLAEAKAAAAKYGVDVVGVQSIVLSRNVSYETAAKQLADILGITSPQ